jgi:hypothetical protein
VIEATRPVALSARLFSSIDQLKEEAERIVQRFLKALGGAPYVRAIAEDAIAVDDFLALAGEDSPQWLTRGERALLGTSVVAASTAGHSQRRL